MMDAATRRKRFNILMAVVTFSNLVVVSLALAWLFLSVSGLGVSTTAAIVAAWCVFAGAWSGHLWRSRLREISREEEEARRGGTPRVRRRRNTITVPPRPLRRATIFPVDRTLAPETGPRKHTAPCGGRPAGPGVTTGSGS